jgi:hypothetical protein
MKMTVFWDIAPCSLVETGRHFRDVYCLHHQGDEMMVVSTSETSVNFYQTTLRNIPEEASSGNISIFLSRNRANLINIQTLLHFNIRIGGTSSYSRIRLKHVAVISTCTVQNKCNVNY